MYLYAGLLTGSGFYFCGGIMKINYKKYHVLSSILLCLLLLIIAFSDNNPLVLGIISALCIFILVSGGEKKKIKTGIIMFIPFFIITMIINSAFVWEGRTILFYISGKEITLESIIYSFITTYKLLIVIYIFMILGVMIDSDRAVSFFSGKIPKSTLMLMISLKLFPYMRNRLFNLKEVYSIRGVDFQGKSISEKIRSFIPVLSVLLEDSLEDSFEIGEASYVRGFLSSKRTIYDRQKLRSEDIYILILAAACFISFIIMEILKIDKFNVYISLAWYTVLNCESITLSVFVSAFFMVFIRKGIRLRRQ